MRTTLRKIGNSRGIILPAPLLAQTSITEDVNITIEGGRLIIEACAPQRPGWYAAYDPAAEDEDAWSTLAPATDSAEWEW